MKLELFYFDACPYCQIVLDKMTQLKLAHFIEKRDIMNNHQYRQQLIDATGRKTVPCLFIDNQPMFESQDIMKWLERNAELILMKAANKV